LVPSFPREKPSAQGCQKNGRSAGQGCKLPATGPDRAGLLRHRQRLESGLHSQADKPLHHLREKRDLLHGLQRPFILRVDEIAGAQAWGWFGGVHSAFSKPLTHEAFVKPLPRLLL